MIEIETPQEIEVISNGIDVEARALDVEVVDLKELDITVAKREYVITGDSIYVPVLYDDAPQWMKDLVNLTVDVSIETANASALAQLTSILTTFATSYVPLNQYTQSIVNLSTADTNMRAVIETLNSNFNDGLNLANSQIINLQTTKASKTEVVTQVIDTLAAQLTTPGSDIGAVIANINQAIANEATARANSFNVLNTSLSNVGENVSGNSTAISGLHSSVTNINGTLSAQAGQITTLSNNLQSGSGTWATADTAVTNTLNSTITNGLATVESKWAYNSNIVINGNTYSSGFGLSNSAGTGVGSEFWINADKLKMTTTGYNGTVYSPFSVNGSTGEISFNGKVSFSNVTNVPQLGSTPQEVVTAINNAQTTTINGPRITTGSITAGQIQAGSISADRLSSTNGISTVWNGGGLVSSNFNGTVSGNIGNPTQGFRLSSNAAGTSSDPNIYGAYIKGATLEGSYLNVNDVKVIAEGFPNNFGPLYTTQVATAQNGGPFAGTAYLAITPALYIEGRDYQSSGFRSLRSCSINQRIIIKASASGWSNFSNGAPANTTINIEYRIGSNAWTSIASASNDYAGKAVAYVNTIFTIPSSSYIAFRAVGGNLGYVYTDIEVILVNSDT